MFILPLIMPQWIRSCFSLQTCSHLLLCYNKEAFLSISYFFEGFHSVPNRFKHTLLSLSLAERTGSLGCVGWILVILSGIFTALLFPITIWFCLKVSELKKSAQQVRVQKLIFPLLHIWMWIELVLWSSCCYCRLFRSMSAQLSSDWAALQTGRLKDQVETLTISIWFFFFFINCIICGLRNA